ncbi:MAG: hypothetical protein V4702_03850 [Patescibacteria group bacterium]
MSHNYDRVLLQRIDEVLQYIWDPIGVAGEPAARDEYDHYLPELLNAILGGASKESVVDILNKIAADSMELTMTDDYAKRTHRAVEIIFDWADYLKENLKNEP